MIYWLVIGLATFACRDAAAKEPNARPTGASGVPYRGINEFFIAELQAAAKGETKDARPARQVDFRYQPSTWQSAICMPDDPDKALAGKRGEFLDEYGGGNKAEPFALAIEHTDKVVGQVRLSGEGVLPIVSCVIIANEFVE